MEQSGYQDFIENIPSDILNVTYNDNKVIDGNILTPTLTNIFPNIILNNKDEDGLYTLIMTDPDAPSRSNPSFREFIHYVCINIKGNDIKTGQEIASYIGPAPPYNSGLHRYYFVVYKQTSKIDSELAIEYYKNRGGLKSNQWCITNKCEMAHSWTMFQSEWDISCDATHEAIGFVPPPTYRSPKQIEKHGNA